MSDSKGPPKLPPGARLDLALATCLIAALLSAVASFSPWWYLTTTGSGTSSTVDYYPGTSLWVVTNGGGGVTTYAASGVPSVGDLYAVVLAGTIALVVLVGAVTVYGFGVTRGKWGSAAGRRAARSGLLGSLFLSLFLATAVPAAQPGLYRADNPAGACTSPSVPPACGSFWGTSHAGGITSTWGAGFGWWLDLSAAVLLLLGLTLGVAWALRSSRSAPAGDGPPARLTPPVAVSPVPLEELRRLAELKWLSDSGQVAPGTFEQAKRQLLEASPPLQPAGPGPRTPLPSEELDLLKTLHTTGVLTDAEYELLERRVLLWI
jgi:hypothetical protein